MDIRLTFNTPLHPQTDRQMEQFIQTLEEMLRLFVLNFKGS
jgi:hypothetical protein